jgi:serine/threonine-protein kinase
MMATAPIGDEAERFTIERKLAEGGMAEVYLARRNQPGVGEKVVMKSLLPSFLDNKDYLAMMLAEARLAAGLSHPNIVRIEDLIDVGGRPFIVMEYLDGQTLRQIVQRAITQQRSLPIWLVCRLAIQVLAGLGHAHDRQDDEGRSLGLVHRDVSLANVIVTWSGRVKLIDFGIAKATQMVSEELTQAGQLKGKSAYMSPEQVRREPLDRRSDLFSVGVVLWEMLTRRRLFARRNELQNMMAVVSEDAPPPSSVVAELPGELDAICLKALARDREQRYQTADQMREALEALMAAQGWTATDAELSEELASMFPVESPAVLELEVDAEDAAPSFPALYGEEQEAATTIDLPPPVPPVEAESLPPPPVMEWQAERRPATFRSSEVSLFNQRLPGPSVYDDWYAVPRTMVNLRTGGRHALWIFLLSCLLLAGAAAGVLLERTLAKTSAAISASGAVR